MVNLTAKPYNLDEQGIKWVKDTMISGYMSRKMKKRV